MVINMKKLSLITLNYKLMRLLKLLNLILKKLYKTKKQSVKILQGVMQMRLPILMIIMLSTLLLNGCKTLQPVAVQCPKFPTPPPALMTQPKALQLIPQALR